MRHPSQFRSDRGPRVAAACLLAGLAAAGCGGVVPGPEVPEDRVLLRWGGDVLAAGQAVDLPDSVAGDVMAAGGELRFTGTARGSYLGVGGEQEIDGRVEESLRGAGGVIRLRGEVARNVTVAGGEIFLERDAVVGRNAYLAGGEVEVLGTVEGSLRIAGGEVLLDGPVTGDVEVEAGRLRVGPGARVGGDFRYQVTEAPAAIDPGARIDGAVVERRADSEEERRGRTLFRVLRVLAFVLSGAVVVALFPGTAAALTAAARERSATALGVGLLTLVLVPLAVVAVAVTLLGAPLAIIGALLYGISLYLAPVPAALWLGALLLEQAPEPGGVRTARAAEFAAGGALLAILGFVPLVGFLVRAAAVLLGLGAAVLVVQDSRRGRAAA